LIKCYHWETNYNTVKLFNFIETKDQYILIFNYCDTTLEKYIEQKFPKKKMPLDKIKLLFLELNHGFRNLYEEKVIHRDIKINNILLEYRFGDENDYIPRIADFGISRENSTDSNPMTASISWLLLSAPEILQNGTDYSFASDLWSIGVLLYKIAFGKYPYEGNGPVDIFMKIMTGPKKFEKSGDANFDDLINKLLEKDKERRITYEQYFNHPFFKYNEPQKIIDLNQKYHLNISSYSREFRTESKNGLLLLTDLSECQFVKLKELNLQYCNINDLSPLTSDTFKDLVFLNLQYNNITNLSALKNIKFLDIKEIYLGLNKITDISPLENIPFKCLSIISFAGNQIIWDEEAKRIYNKITKRTI
jgi:serine/threonine protein kinase